MYLTPPINVTLYNSKNKLIGDIINIYPRLYKRDFCGLGLTIKFTQSDTLYTTDSTSGVDVYNIFYISRVDVYTPHSILHGIPYGTPHG